MSKNKAYPNPDCLRRQSKLACHAIHDLANLGIQVLSIKFKRSRTIIDIANCAGNSKIKSHFSGQGINKQGDHYHTKTAVFSGCEVRWQEVQDG